MDTEILIAGAGPYGVSVAHTCHQRNLPFLLVGKPFDLWFHHTLDTMAIRSDRHSSEVFTEDRRYDVTDFVRRSYGPEAPGILADRLPVSVFRAYLEDLLGRMEFPVAETLVERIAPFRGGFRCDLQDGSSVTARAVVLATGIEAHRFLPRALHSLPGSRVVHGYFVKDFARWRNRHVLVVGSGQSAAETVAHLLPRNRITWLFRTDPIFYSEPINLPKSLFELALRVSSLYYYLPEVLRRPLGRKFVESTITPDMLPVLTDGKVRAVKRDVADLGLRVEGSKVVSPALDLAFDGVVAATGYRYDVRNLAFLNEEILYALRLQGATPWLSSRFETSVPNLYVAGGMAEPVFGPAQRFVFGTRYASLTLGRALSNL